MTRREALALLAASGLGGLTSRDAYGHKGPKGHSHPEAKGNMGPVESVHLHFCGIHLVKADPKLQFVTQHYCSPLGEEMHQCLLYDSAKAGAKLLGVEYIISDTMYRNLPEAEKRYWHPHTYEVLAGGLTAPEMTPEKELAFMKALLPTWGKTWHTWPDPATPVPMGEPSLMWSATGDGQIRSELLEARDKEWKVSGEKLRAARTKALGLEVPQIPQPASVDAVGRQWTKDGEDKPTKK